MRELKRILCKCKCMGLLDSFPSLSRRNGSGAGGSPADSFTEYLINSEAPQLTRPVIRPGWILGNTSSGTPE